VAFPSTVYLTYVMESLGSALLFIFGHDLIVGIENFNWKGIDVERSYEFLLSI